MTYVFDALVPSFVAGLAVAEIVLAQVVHSRDHLAIHAAVKQTMMMLMSSRRWMSLNSTEYSVHHDYYEIVSSKQVLDLEEAVAVIDHISPIHSFSDWDASRVE